jgi:hypothetical protein
VHDERQGSEAHLPADGCARHDSMHVEPERSPINAGNTRAGERTQGGNEQAPSVAAEPRADTGDTASGLAEDPSKTQRMQTQTLSHREVAPDRQELHRRTPRKRTAAKARRHLYNRLTAGGLTLGFLATVLLVAVVLASRDGGIPMPPERCLLSWNAETNGVARRQLNTDAAPLSGTRLQQMWMGVLGDSCALTYLRPDGKGVIWRKTGPDWTQQVVAPLSGLHSSAARASAEPNVEVLLLPGGNIRLHPRMGSVRPKP